MTFDVAFWDEVTAALVALAFGGAFFRVSAAALAKALGKSGFFEVFVAVEEVEALEGVGAAAFDRLFVAWTGIFVFLAVQYFTK